MDGPVGRGIVSLPGAHRIVTIATLRPDGCPQATTVGCAHDGLTIRLLCGRDSQKARNRAAGRRVSITADHDKADILAIGGLPMAAPDVPR